MWNPWLTNSYYISLTHIKLLVQGFHFMLKPREYLGYVI
jgi:hypothetical protein